MSAIVWRRTPPSLAEVRARIEREWRWSPADDRELLVLRARGMRLWEIAEALDRDVDHVAARLVLLEHYGAAAR
jgi:hypothetical protein